jgi:ABC-type ATPase involved in cell division
MALEKMAINVQKPFFMIIAGRSGSGKSWFLEFLMREVNLCNPFDYGIVMSNTSWEKGLF